MMKAVAETSKIPCRWFLLVASIILTAPCTVLGAFTEGQPPYDSCNKTQYYADLISKRGSDVSKWTQQDVIDLITISHRNVLDNVALTSSGDDIILALKDLWKSGTDTVLDIYRDISFPNNLANTQLGWSKEDIWPKGRGWNVLTNKEPWTDIYGKAPAGSSVLVKKDGLFFGTCGRVENSNKCVRPATSETANSTEQDGKVWKPPDDRKGDVARALFYYAARYRDTLNLTLTDCPPFANSQFGYLSELIAWHNADPPDALETYRNDRGCQRWQGNRNPFVDYPNLVSQVFYTQGPDQIIPGSYTYARCTAPTNAPTASPNTCSDLQPGDFPIFMVNSEDVDQVVLFPLSNIPYSVGSLYLTDNPWDGTKFLTTEGTLEFDIPPGGIPAGKIFGTGSGIPYANQWSQVKGSQLFDVNTVEGDNLFLYCLDADKKPRFLTGWSQAGPWYQAGLSASQYGNAHSALPTTLQNAGSIYFNPVKNCVYKGPVQNVPKAKLAANFIDPTLFDCTNSTRIILNTQQSGAPRATWPVLSLVVAAVFSWL